MAHGVEDRTHIRIEDLGEDRVILLGQRGAPLLEARIVEGRVQPPEALHGLLHHRRHVGLELEQEIRQRGSDGLFLACDATRQEDMAGPASSN